MTIHIPYGHFAKPDLLIPFYIKVSPFNNLGPDFSQNGLGLFPVGADTFPMPSALVEVVNTSNIISLINSHLPPPVTSSY